MPDRWLAGPTTMLMGCSLLCRTLEGTTALRPLRAAALVMTPPWTLLQSLQVCGCSVAGEVQACCSAQRQHLHPVLTGCAALRASTDRAHVHARGTLLRAPAPVTSVASLLAGLPVHKAMAAWSSPCCLCTCQQSEAPHTSPACSC